VDNSVEASNSLKTTTVKDVYTVVQKSVDKSVGCELGSNFFYP
jgi:hypothetical protein